MLDEQSTLTTWVIQAAAGGLSAATTTSAGLTTTTVATEASKGFLEKLFIDPAELPDNAYGFIQLLMLAAGYTYVLMIGAGFINEGSELLLLIPSWAGLVGSIILPVLGAVPDGAIVLFSGIGPNAQEQMSVGVGALAGSTIMLLTVPWMLAMFAGRVDLEIDGSCNYKGRPKLTKGAYLGTGVGVSNSVRYAAKIMLITLVPFFVIQIPAIAAGCSLKDQEDGCHTPIIAAWVGGGVCVLLFLFYLWDQFKRAQKSGSGTTNLIDAKIERVEKKVVDLKLMSLTGVFYERLKQGGITDPMAEKVKFNLFLKKYFNEFDIDHSGAIDRNELGYVLKSLGEDPSTEHVDQVMKEIDNDDSGAIDFTEFCIAMEKVVTSAHHLGSHSQTPLQDGWKSAVSVSEVEKGASVMLVPSMIYNDEGIAYHSDSGSGSNKGKAEEEEEESDEEPEMPEHLVNLAPEVQQKRILRRSFMLMLVGTFLVVLFSDPMVGVLSSLGTRMHIPPFYVSFVLAPLVSNGSELLAAYSYAGKKSEKSITISFGTLIGAAAMNNTFCLGLFLFLVAGQGLKWIFTAEVTSIIIVEVAMFCIVIFSGKTMKTWTAGLVIALFPLSIIAVAVMEAAGLD